MKVSEIIRVPEIEQLFSKPHNYEEIKADVASRGVQEAVIVNPAGRLLCGYTRLAIAEELGIEEIAARTVDIIELPAMVEYAILDNIRRRQLTDLQIVEYGIKLEEVCGERQGQRSDLGTECPEVKSGRTRDLVAAELSEKAGVKMSGKKYSRLRTIAMKASPEVKSAFNEGEISQQKALSLCRCGHKDQALLLESDMVLSCAGEECIEAEKRLSELGEVADREEALRGYSDIVRKAGGWENKCATVRLRLERRAGELLKEILEEQGRLEAADR